MTIKKFNISKPEKYNSGNEEKTRWHNIGTITEFHKDDGSVSRIIEIPAISLKASVFEQQTGDRKPSHQALPAEEESQDVDYPDEEINLADIPF